MKYIKFILIQGLYKVIGYLFIDRDVFQDDLTISDLFPNKVLININIFGSGIKLRVFYKGYNTLVIIIDNYNLYSGFGQLGK